MNAHVLTGLDGSNPLAYLAALGVLVALDEAHVGSEHERPRLSWRLEGVWRPVLHCDHEDLDAVLRALDEDREAVKGDPVLGFSYCAAQKPIADVKPSAQELRAQLVTWGASATPFARRTVDWFSALVSEGALDGKGASKPSALHFYAGQQRFLTAASTLANAVNVAALREAVVGPWTYTSKLPVMSWDNTDTRDHALRASNPASEKLGNPGADWLAVRGLLCFPTAAARGYQETAGVSGTWKKGLFTWSLWSTPLTLVTARSVVTLTRPAALSANDRDRRGISSVFTSTIRRSGEGGYGAFSAAAVV